MGELNYIMEGDEESLRLDLKTDPKIIDDMSVWAGVKSGMRIADLGCGPGKTTFYLHNLASPGGSAIGVDISPDRIEYARKNYADGGAEFMVGDIRKPLTRFGMFDFVWVRFVLEHYLNDSFNIVKNVSSVLKPGGIMCLVDLDYNCLSHYGLPSRLEKALYGIMKLLEKHANFDPYVGRKLYAFLYDLGYEEIDVRIDAHHCIFGDISENDAYNWMKKVEIAAQNSGYKFAEYEDKYDGFLSEFKKSFYDRRRFTYTPVMVCRGRKA